MGDALLLQWRRFVELVLQLPLRPASLRYAFLACSIPFGSNAFSDLKDIKDMVFNFDLGKPFRPFEQLMGVMPEASKELLPDAYRVSSRGAAYGPFLLMNE